jgi:anti-sigma B factor antagonist
VQPKERSLHLLLWTAAQRKQALANDRGRRAHPAGCSSTTKPKQSAGWNKPGAWRARSTTLAPGAAPPTGSLQDRRLLAAGELDLKSVRSGAEATVTLRGELDCASAPVLNDELGELLREGACRITLSLAEVTFMDATGLATLVSALRAAREAGGDVVLHAARPCVRKVLAITGVDRLFVFT